MHLLRLLGIDLFRLLLVSPLDLFVARIVGPFCFSSSFSIFRLTARPSVGSLKLYIFIANGDLQDNCSYSHACQERLLLVDKLTIPGYFVEAHTIIVSRYCAIDVNIY